MILQKCSHCLPLTNHQTRASNIHNFPSPTHTACSYVSPDNVLTKHLSLENFALNKYCDINAVMINYNTLKRQIHEDLRGIAWTRKDSRGLQRIRKDLFKFFKENSQILASFRDCAMQNCQNLVYVELWCQTHTSLQIFPYDTAKNEPANRKSLRHNAKTS